MKHTLIQKIYEIHTELGMRINDVIDADYPRKNDGDDFCKLLAEMQSLCVTKMTTTSAFNFDDVKIKLQLMGEYEPIDEIHKENPDLVWPKLHLAIVHDVDKLIQN